VVKLNLLVRQFIAGLMARFQAQIRFDLTRIKFFPSPYPTPKPDIKKRIYKILF